MNEYFCGVGKKLQTKMPDCGGEFLNYLPEQISEIFFLSPVVQEELVIEIKKIKPKEIMWTRWYRGHGYSIMPNNICR